MLANTLTVETYYMYHACKFVCHIWISSSMHFKCENTESLRKMVIIIKDVKTGRSSQFLSSKERFKIFKFISVRKLIKSVNFEAVFFFFFFFFLVYCKKKENSININIWGFFITLWLTYRNKIWNLEGYIFEKKKDHWEIMGWTSVFWK